jgi:alpha-galactosidase
LPASRGRRTAPSKPADRDYSDRILTPKAPAEPRVNGPTIYGQRPGRPFLYTIPATGDRPMTFTVDNLPDGLKVDEKTGRITGKIEKEGTYTVTLVATNDKGKNGKKFRIVIGDTIALTPPLGWNSWNSWAKDVDQEKVLASAKAMANKGLINHGWTYINIDDAWQGKRGGEFNGIQPNDKFPDMKGLTDQIHGMGLKIGIYSTPWVTSYAMFNGGSSDDENGKWDQPLAKPEFRHDGKHLFADNDAKQWAAWGIDYLKYDWNPRSKPQVSDDVFEKQVADMAAALKNSGRDIVTATPTPCPSTRSAGFRNTSTAGERPATSATRGGASPTSASSRTSGPSTRAPAIGTIRTCSWWATSAGAKISIRATSPPTSSISTSRSGRCSPRRC